MRNSDSLINLIAALCAVQGAMKPAEKSQSNDFHHNKYADLADVWESLREHLKTNGFAVVQPARIVEGNRVEVETILFHTSGEFIAETLSALPNDQKPQSIGSCITYLRRYGIATLTGAVARDDDDDGEGAQGRDNNRLPQQQNKPQGQQRSPQPPPPKPAPKPALEVVPKLHPEKLAILNEKLTKFGATNPGLIKTLTLKTIGVAVLPVDMSDEQYEQFIAKIKTQES